MTWNNEIRKHMNLIENKNPHGVSDEFISALHFYTTTEDIPNMLKSDRDRIIKAFDAEMPEMEIYDWVHRGITAESKFFEQEFIKSDFYLSASFSESTAEGFMTWRWRQNGGTPALLSIETLIGAKAIKVDDYIDPSGPFGEQELILNRGSEFKVEKVSWVNVHPDDEDWHVEYETEDGEIEYEHPDKYAVMELKQIK